MEYLFWATLVSFVFSLLLTPLVRNVFLRFGVVDLPDSRKLHRLPIPRVGGIAIAISYVATLAIFLSLFSTNIPWSSETRPQRGLLLAIAIVFATGLCDDLITLRPWQKVTGQLLAAVVAFSSGIQIHVLKGHPLDFWYGLPLTILWLLACSNAFNLIDGMDGLAAGIGLFATITSLIAGLIHNNVMLAFLTAPLAGCLFGFLRYNFNPASIFLGDCGSLLIGFLLGCYGIMWGQKSATLLGMTAPMLSLAIPFIDTGLAIVRRYLRHQPIFGADRGHIHHRLLDRGLSVRSSSLVLYAVCGLTALLSLLQNAAQNQYGSVVIILFALAAWAGINHLGYTEFAVARKLLLTGEFRQIIDQRTRLHQFEQQLRDSDNLHSCWQILRRGARDFGFVGLRMLVQGRVFEDALPYTTGLMSQIRIPLPDSQYINICCALSDEPGRAPLAAFARTVETELKSKLSNPDFMSTTLSVQISPLPQQESRSGIPLSTS